MNATGLAELQYFEARARGDRDAMAVHARTAFGDGRAPSGRSELAREMEQLSAQCRAIATVIDQQRIASVLATTTPRCTRSDDAEMRCWMCGEDALDDCFC